LVTSCVAAAFLDMLLKEKENEDKEKDVRSYWMILRKIEDTGK